MWHRYTYDGYGEKADGSPVDPRTGGIGRLWPLLSGERGEYELANRRDALSHLRTMHRSANDGYMIPEQAWDRPEPTSFGHVSARAPARPAPWRGRWRSTSASLGHRLRQPGRDPAGDPARYVTGPPLRRRADASPPAGRAARRRRHDPAHRHHDGHARLRRRQRREPQRPARAARSGSRFDATVDLPDLRNQWSSSRRGPRWHSTATRTVLSYGDRIGSLADPAGDDDGPGTYVYPANPVYSPGTFDLTGDRCLRPRRPGRLRDRHRRRDRPTPSAATRSPTSGSTSTSATAAAAPPRPCRAPT